MRIRQKRMSDDAEDCTEHSIVWGMFMATTLNAVTFMGKSYSTMQNVVQNEEKIALKQMFDIIAQTTHNDEEIYCLDKILYQRNTWTQLSLIYDPVVIGLQSAKVTCSQILCYVSAKFFNILNATKLGKTELQEYEPRRTTAILPTSKESRRNSSGIFCQGSHRCSSVIKSVIC